MKIDKVSYSSSLGIQITAVNFSVKYRHKIFAEGKVKRRVIESFRKTESEYSPKIGLRILELGVDKDHVHLIFPWGPSVSLSRVMQLLNGRSARDVLRTFPDLRAEKFWDGHMWSPAYHFFTTGTADLNHHLEYVKSQGEPRRPMPGPGQQRLDAFVA